MRVQLDTKAIEAIEQALNHGNNAEVRRKGGGVVVAEIKRKTVYCDLPMAGDQGQSEPAS